MPRGIIVKDAPYNASKNDCWIVLTRKLAPGPDFMQWQPISKYRWVVVCLGRKDALECVLYVGGQMYPRPQNGATYLDDEQYEAWLLAKHFRIQQYVPSGRREMTFGEWVNGWVPGYEELTSDKSSPAITYRVYESRLPQTTRGMWQQAIHNHVSRR